LEAFVKLMVTLDQGSQRKYCHSHGQFGRRLKKNFITVKTFLYLSVENCVQAYTDIEAFTDPFPFVMIPCLMPQRQVC